MNNYYNPQIHHRRSIRLQGYDYSQKGMYFLTLCVKEKECIFGSIHNGVMTLNAVGQIAANEWLNTANIRENVAIHDFVVMPNHLHGIVEITSTPAVGANGNSPLQTNGNSPLQTNGNSLFVSPSKSIGAIVRGFKIATTKKIKDLPEMNDDLHIQEWIDNHLPQIWQRNYYEHIIRDYGDYERIANYINTNPIRWEEDMFNH